MAESKELSSFHTQLPASIWRLCSPFSPSRSPPALRSTSSAPTTSTNAFYDLAEHPLHPPWSLVLL